MKKNLSEILQSADAEALEGLFDSVKAQEKPARKTEKRPKSNRPIFFRVVAFAASFALLLSGAIILTTLLTRETGSSISPTVPGGTSKADLNNESGGSDSSNSYGRMVDNPKPYDSSFNALTRRADFNEIIWDAEAELPYVADDSPALVEWNGLSLSEALYNKLLSASDNDLFAVTVKVKPDFPYTIKDYPYLPRLVVVNMNEFGFVVDNFVYSGYHQATDQHYEIAVMTKAQLASLRQNYEAPEGWLPFNFESGYFTTLPYPEEDIAYAISTYASVPNTRDAPDASPEEPATILE